MFVGPAWSARIFHISRLLDLDPHFQFSGGQRRSCVFSIQANTNSVVDCFTGTVPITSYHMIIIYDYTKYCLFIITAVLIT